MEKVLLSRSSWTDTLIFSALRHVTTFLSSVRLDSTAICCGPALNGLWPSNHDLILETSPESRLILAENNSSCTLLSDLDVSNFEEKGNLLSASVTS